MEDQEMPAEQLVGNDLGMYASCHTFKYFGGISVNTQQWAQPFTAGVHSVSSKKCQLEAVE